MSPASGRCRAAAVATKEKKIFAGSRFGGAQRRPTSAASAQHE